MASSNYTTCETAPRLPPLDAAAPHRTLSESVALAARHFEPRHLGIERNTEGHGSLPNDVNNLQINLYALLTLGARLVAVSSNKKRRVVLEILPNSTRGLILVNELASLSTPENVCDAVRESIDDDTIKTIRETIVSQIHPSPLTMFVREHRITDVHAAQHTTKGSAVEQQLRVAVVAAFSSDSLVSASGADGSVHTFHWELVGFSLSVISFFMRVAGKSGKHSHLATEEGAPSTVKEVRDAEDAVARATPVDVQGCSSSSVGPSTSTNSGNSSINKKILEAHEPKKVEANSIEKEVGGELASDSSPPNVAPLSPSPPPPRKTTPEVITDRTSRLVRELKEIEAHRNTRIGVQSLVVPSSQSGGAHLRRISPLLNRLKENAHNPIPEDCAYKNVIATLGSGLLSDRRATLPTYAKQSSPTRQGIVSTLWEKRQNDHRMGDIQQVKDHNQTYPSSRVSPPTRKHRGGESGSPRGQTTGFFATTHKPPHPGHTTGDGSIGAPQQHRTSPSLAKGCDGESRITKLVREIDDA